MRRILMLVVLLATLAGAALANVTPTRAASGANFIATGHDLDFHCDGGGPGIPECDYLKIVVDKVRNGSALPILSLDQGSELYSSLVSLYGAANVVNVDPSNTALFNATPFTAPGGTPLYSAIVTASDSTCGGCDNTPAGEANINARKADFTTFFNNGGGILALSGGFDNYPTYYNFVPLAGLAAANIPCDFDCFATTVDGAALGITSSMINCCQTHNAFNAPPAPFDVLEVVAAGITGAGTPITIAVFNGTIACTGPSCSFGGGGTDTPELGSGELLATGLLPILGIWLYRRRARRTAPDANTPAA